MAVEVTEHAVAHGVLEFAPVGGRQMGGLVELDRALRILAEHAVDDTDVARGGSRGYTMLFEVSVAHRADRGKLLHHDGVMTYQYDRLSVGGGQG